jgi:transposase InsO family protein
MDFIMDLPSVKAKDSILVVVDRFTKMAHFTPCSKSITAEETVQLILDKTVRLHGLPEEIVSDRGPQFASKFWQRLFELLGVDIRLSSAFHPETDGQTERTNQTFKQYLRCTVGYQ